MKTTNSKIVYSGQITPADPHGNNIAWACSDCGHPILFVCLDNQKGFNGNYTVCKGCDKSYTVRPESEDILVIEAAE